MSKPRLRVLYIPSRSDFGPYRSLSRLEDTTRQALAQRFDLVELAEHPASDVAAFLAAFAAARPLDAVLDLSDHVIHGPVAQEIPTLLFALGNMTNGATLPWLRRPRLKTSDVMLLNCTSDLTLWDAVLGGSGPVGEWLPLGVDIDHFRPRGAEEDAATRQRLGLSGDDFVLLYAGRLNVQKNLHSLLMLLSELSPREPRVRLVLAGAFDSIPHSWLGVKNDGYEELLRDFIDRRGLADRVIFAGNLDDEDLARACSAADVFVTLTLHNNENFGYAAVEAMAAGRPVVASHFGGLKDTVVHGETGYHVESLMTEHGLRAVWRQAVAPLILLASDPALARRLGTNARDRAVRHYSLNAYADTLERIVRDAVASCSRDPGRPGSEFRFARQSMDLHLGNLYRTWRRSEGKKREGSSGGRPSDALFRWFQGPYATRDIALGFPLGDGDRLALLTRVRLDRRQSRLDSLDPIWPRTYDLEPSEMETLAALEPGATVKEILDRGESLGLDRERAMALLDRLVREGVAFLERDFTASAS